MSVGPFRGLAEHTADPLGPGGAGPLGCALDSVVQVMGQMDAQQRDSLEADSDGRPRTREVASSAAESA